MNLRDTAEQNGLALRASRTGPRKSMAIGRVPFDFKGTCSLPELPGSKHAKSRAEIQNPVDTALVRFR